MSSDGCFAALLTEPNLLLHVLRFASRPILLSCSLANRLFYRISSDDRLWKPIVCSRFKEYEGFVPDPPDGPDDFPAWKKRFIRKNQSEMETAGQVALLTNQDTDVWRCSQCQGVIFVAACGLPMEIIPCEGCGTYIGGVDHKIWPGTEFLGSLKEMFEGIDEDRMSKTMSSLREFLRSVPEVKPLSESRADPPPRWIDVEYERETMSEWNEYRWTRKARFYLKKAIDSLAVVPDDEKEEEGSAVAILPPSFPTRAVLQQYDGKLDGMSRIVAAELGPRNIPIVPYSPEQMRLGLFGGICELTDMDVIVGDWECTRAAMKKLGISFPEPPDYPKCLKHLLHRRIWETTLQEAPEGVFIKPSIHAKKFSGLISSSEWISTLQQFMGVPANEPIYCSEVVKFISEYRTYVIKGEIKATCHYATKGDRAQVPIDETVVRESVRILEESEELKQPGSNLKCLAGYGIDFGILEKEDGQLVTALIEVNDGISLGHYEGLSWEDYTELLVARWEQLVKSKSAED